MKQRIHMNSLRQKMKQKFVAKSFMTDLEFLDGLKEQQEAKRDVHQTSGMVGNSDISHI